MTVSTLEREEVRQAVAAELRQPGMWLTFSPALEERLERDTGPGRVRHLVHSAVLALILSNAFLITDGQVMPDVFGLAIALRLMCTIVYSIGIIYTARSTSALAREAVHGVSLTAAVLGTIALVSSSHAPEHGYACITYVLFTNYVGLVTRLRFRWCLAFSTLTTLAALVSIMWHLGVQPGGVGPGVQHLIVLSMLTAAAFTVYANYTIEAGERRSYLLTLDQRLAAEQLAEFNSRLSTLSATDWLTGAANRRGLEVYLARAWAQSALTGQPIALLMIDVDHFKLFNDHRGHPAGDACLTAMAKLIGQQLRQDHDYLGRYGGEEFAVVLPNTHLADAVHAAERIRQAVEDFGLPHGAPGGGTWVTVSIGASAAEPHRAGDPAWLIAAADEALYRSKQTGRNRVHPAPLSMMQTTEHSLTQD